MKFNKCLLVLFGLIAVSFTGCKNEDVDERHFDNKFYISSSIVTDDLLIKGSGLESRAIESRLAQPAARPVTVTFEARPEMAALYNLIYKDNAVALPSKYYEIVQNTVEIGAGAVTGGTIDINFKEIQTLDSKKRYVLPVTVSDCNGVNVLDSRRTVYYIVKGAALINVVANIAEMYFPVNWSDVAKPLVTNMKTITVEALVRSSDWEAGRDNPLSTLIGIEGSFLIRIGDADRDRDQLQLVAPGGNWPNKDVAPGLPVDEWVHIAVVWDATTNERIYYQNGEVVASSTAALSGSVTLDSRSCYIGRAYDDTRWLPGEISELRVWNIQRTADEIKDNPYEVDPATPGLVAYWKFDEGTGGQITDYAKGSNITSAGGTPTWIPVEIPALE